MVVKENLDRLKIDMRPVDKPGRGKFYEGEFIDFLLDPKRFYQTAPRNKKIYRKTIDKIYQQVEEIECFIKTIWLVEDSSNSYPVSPDILIKFLYDFFENETVLPDLTSYDKGKKMSVGTYKLYNTKLNNSYRFFSNYNYLKQ